MLHHETVNQSLHTAKRDHQLAKRHQQVSVQSPPNSADDRWYLLLFQFFFSRSLPFDWQFFVRSDNENIYLVYRWRFLRESKHKINK